MVDMVVGRRRRRCAGGRTWQRTSALELAVKIVSARLPIWERRRDSPCPERGHTARYTPQTRRPARVLPRIHLFLSVVI